MQYLEIYNYAITVLILLILFFMFSPLLFITRLNKDTINFIFTLYVANIELSKISKDTKTGYLNVIVENLFSLTQTSETTCKVILDNVSLELNLKSQKKLLKEFEKIYFKGLISKNNEKLLSLAKNKGII